MSDDTGLHLTLLKTAERLVRPLVRVLLAHGLGHSALYDLCRRVFVEESSAMLIGKGKKATASAISGMTGLSRKEVTRLQALESEDLNQASARRNRAIQILSGWANDPMFNTAWNATGTPTKIKSLPIAGEPASFNHLVKKYGGDVTPVAMLGLLTESGNLRVNGDSVELLSEAYLPMQTPTERLEIFGTDGAELLKTIEHNMTALPTERRFQRKVSNTRIRPDALAAFKALNEQRAMALLEDYDAWLTEHEVSHESETEAVYVAAGIYVYEHYQEDAS